MGAVDRHADHLRLGRQDRNGLAARLDHAVTMTMEARETTNSRCAISIVRPGIVFSEGGGYTTVTVLAGSSSRAAFRWRLGLGP